MSASVMPTGSNRRSALRFGLAAALVGLTKAAPAATTPTDTQFVMQLRPDLPREKVDQLLDGIAAAWCATRNDPMLSERGVA